MSLDLDGDRTGVLWTREGESPTAPLAILTAGADRAAGDRALAAARSFGQAAGVRERPVEIAFAGSKPSPSRPPSTAWMAGAAIALADAPLLRAASPVATGERDGVFTVKTELPASSPLAAALVRAVLLAVSPPLVDHETDPATVADAALAQWRREPAARPMSVPPDASDGRWLWAAALALLLVEEAVRRRRRTGAIEEADVRAA